MSYPSGSSSIPPSPSVPPPPSGFPPEFEEPEISTVVCPAFWALSNARVAARVGTGEKLIPAKMSFRSSPGTNWMFTPVILAAVNFSAVSAARLLICNRNFPKSPKSTCLPALRPPIIFSTVEMITAATSALLTVVWLATCCPNSFRVSSPVICDLA